MDTLPALCRLLGWIVLRVQRTPCWRSEQLRDKLALHRGTSLRRWRQGRVEDMWYLPASCLETVLYTAHFISLLPPPLLLFPSLLSTPAFQTLLQQHIINLTLQCFAMTRPKATSKLKWPDSKRNKSYSNVIRVFKMWWTGAFPLPTSLQTHSTLWWLLDFFPFPSLH